MPNAVDPPFECDSVVPVYYFKMLNRQAELVDESEATIIISPFSFI
jgi:hypothetical protein